MHNEISKIITERYIIGGKWNNINISHNILRSDYLIYTSSYESKHKCCNMNLTFIKLDKLFTEENYLLLECRTIDLLNFYIYLLLLVMKTRLMI